MSQIVLYGPSGLPLTPSTPAIVDSTFGALRVSSWPFNWRTGPQVLGQYNLAIEVAASATLQNPLEMRWSSSTALMVLLRVEVGSSVGTAAGAAGFHESQILHGRGWSAAPTGAASTPVGIPARVTMPTSLANFFVYPTADGTVVFDSVAFAYKVDRVLMTSAGSASGPANMLYRCDVEAGEQPEVFYQNEGFKLLYGSVFATGGAESLRIMLTWAEIALPVLLES